METETTFSDHILVATFWGSRQIGLRTTELWTTMPCGPNVRGPSGQLGPGNVPIVPYQKQNTTSKIQYRHRCYQVTIMFRKIPKAH